MTCSILIPSAVYEKTLKRLSRLAKQANVTLEAHAGSTYLYRKTRQWRERLDAQGVVRERYQVIEIDQNVVLECSRLTVGELPSQNGFDFLGKIVHTVAGNMLMMASHARSEQLPEEWKTAKPTCDHCKTKRSRKDTFIIKTPEGAIVRVGRNCLADFLKTSPASMIAISAFQDELLSITDGDSEDEGGVWGGGAGWGPSVWWYLCCAFASTRMNGFVKSGDWQDGPSTKVPTRTTAMFLANPCPKDDNQLGVSLKKEWKEGQPTDVDVTDAVGALIWLEQNTDTGQYIHNLTVACSIPGLQRETQGLIASLPAAYNRAMGKIALAKAVPAVSKHYGTVKERITVEVTVMTVQPLESLSRWGGSDLIKMRTDDGCELVTFTTSASSPAQRDVGKRYSVTGTIKKHDTYKGQANTQLTRCIFECLTADEAVA